MPASFNIRDIQPTMRETVTWLRGMDFTTTDSGDGVTNVEAGMDGALDVPHVFMVSSRDMGFIETDVIWGALKRKGLDKVPGVSVEMSYSPLDRKIIIALYGVTDAVLANVPA